MAEGTFLEGAVRYPDELPCPHADTDLTLRERRYISDIGEVKKLRAFQISFQAKRQTISFVFTPSQSRRFFEWYKNDIIEGGAWFYADWPILHKEKDIAYRFVTRPVWEFLALGNYHVSATVELYDRKVGKRLNVYTSKLYPVFITDDVKSTVALRAMPFEKVSDDIKTTASVISIDKKTYIYTEYPLNDDIESTATLVMFQRAGYIEREYKFTEDVSSVATVADIAVTAKKVSYDRIVDDIATAVAIVGVEYATQ